jgi:hypothetical protein
MKNHVDGIKTQRLLRLVWIEWFASKHGRINRSDIADAWGISLPQATNDMTLMYELFPQRYSYDVRIKAYKWKNKGPKINAKPVKQLVQQLDEYLNK